MSWIALASGSCLPLRNWKKQVTLYHAYHGIPAFESGAAMPAASSGPTEPVFLGMVRAEYKSDTREWHLNGIASSATFRRHQVVRVGGVPYWLKVAQSTQATNPATSAEWELAPGGSIPDAEWLGSRWGRRWFKTGEMVSVSSRKNFWTPDPRVYSYYRCIQDVDYSGVADGADGADPAYDPEHWSPYYAHRPWAWSTLGPIQVSGDPASYTPPTRYTVWRETNEWYVAPSEALAGRSERIYAVETVTGRMSLISETKIESVPMPTVPPSGNPYAPNVSLGSVQAVDGWKGDYPAATGLVSPQWGADYHTATVRGPDVPWYTDYNGRTITTTTSVRQRVELLTPYPVTEWRDGCMAALGSQSPDGIPVGMSRDMYYGWDGVLAASDTVGGLGFAGGTFILYQVLPGVIPLVISPAWQQGCHCAARKVALSLVSDGTIRVYSDGLKSEDTYPSQCSRTRLDLTSAVPARAVVTVNGV